MINDETRRKLRELNLGELITVHDIKSHNTFSEDEPHFLFGLIEWRHDGFYGILSIVVFQLLLEYTIALYIYIPKPMKYDTGR